MITPDQAIDTLEGVEHHGSLGEAGDVLRRLIAESEALRPFVAIAEKAAGLCGGSVWAEFYAARRKLNLIKETLEQLDAPEHQQRSRDNCSEPKHHDDDKPPGRS